VRWNRVQGEATGFCPRSGQPCCALYLVEKEWFRSSSRTFPVLLMAPSVSRKSSRGWPLWMGCRMTHFKGDKMLVPPISARILLMLSQATARLSCPKQSRTISLRTSTLPAPRKRGSLFTHLAVRLTGRKEGLEGGSKPNDIEETRWHQALESNQQGILGGGKQADIRCAGSLTSCPSFTSKTSAQTLPCHHTLLPPALACTHLITKLLLSHYLLHRESTAHDSALSKVP